eukprot:scaffold32697_cov33-Tisochrysis_lutea.AAC.4
MPGSPQMDTWRSTGACQRLQYPVKGGRCCALCTRHMWPATATSASSATCHLNARLGAVARLDMQRLT